MDNEIEIMAGRLAKLAMNNWTQFVAEHDLLNMSDKAIEEAAKDYVRQIREAIEKLDTEEEEA